MKNLSLSFCLVIAALLGSVESGFAERDLPDCSGEYEKNTWNDCVGNLLQGNGHRYIGEFKRNYRHGKGELQL